jgi:hypothetical protein
LDKDAEMDEGVGIEEEDSDDGMYNKLILGPAPLLYVDVNLGPSKVSRIVLYEHDVPDEVALEFAKE